MLNTRSGSSPTRAALTEALQSAAVTGEILETPEANLAEWMAGIAARSDLLVAAGGDGTVSVAAAAAIAAGKPLGIIPTGTLNHFARDAGLPLTLPDAVAILRAGHTRRFAVGIVNGRIFINNASIGAYPRMVWERKRARQRGLPRAVASMLAALETWIELRSDTVRLAVDGHELVRRSPFVFVGNSEYDVEGVRLGRRPRMTDGKLSLYVAPDTGRLGALALPVRALLGSLKRHEKFEAWLASSIRLDMEGPRVGVALDGELAVLETPLRYSVRPGALRVIVPAEAA